MNKVFKLEFSGLLFLGGFILAGYFLTLQSLHGSRYRCSPMIVKISNCTNQKPQLCKATLSTTTETFAKPQEKLKFFEFHKSEIDATENPYANLPTPDLSFQDFILNPPIHKREPSSSGFNRAYIDRKSKLLYCWIPKVACTQFKALFCRRNGYRDVLDPEKDHNKIHFQCFPKTEAYQHHKHRNIMLDNSWKKWATIRDPIDRFISGYADKCILTDRSERGRNWCYGCRDLKCFVQRNYAALARYSRVISRKELAKLENGFANIDHFFPQFWFCGFSKFLKQYHLFRFDKSSVFRDEIQEAFRDVGFPRSIIRRGWGRNGRQGFLESRPKTGRRASQNTPNYSALIQRTLARNCLLTQTLLKTYWVDYVNFSKIGLAPAPWVVDCCRKYARSCRQFLTIKL